MLYLGFRERLFTPQLCTRHSASEITLVLHRHMASVVRNIGGGVLQNALFLRGNALTLFEMNGWYPVGALAGDADLLVKLIDFLKRQVLGFVDEEPHECDADEATAKPDEENLGLEISVPGTVVYQVRRCV